MRKAAAALALAHVGCARTPSGSPAFQDAERAYCRDVKSALAAQLTADRAAILNAKIADEIAHPQVRYDPRIDQELSDPRTFARNFCP